MNPRIDRPRRHTGRASLRLFAAGVCLLAACSADPTQAGSGEPFFIEASRSITFQEAGRPFSVSAWLRDARGNRLAGSIRAVANDVNIHVDSVVYQPESAETRIHVTPIGLDTTAYLVVSGGGLTTTVHVRSLPAFLSVAAPTVMLSGTTAAAGVNALDAFGIIIAANVRHSVTSSDTTKLKVNPSGSFTARSPGLATLTFTGPGGKVSTTRDITVVPIPFVTATPGTRAP